MAGITRTSLLSRIIRINVSNGKTGSEIISQPQQGVTAIARRIKKLTNLAPTRDDEGGWLGWLWNTSTSFIGWAVSTAWNLISFSASAIWSWVVAGISALKAFDWNATDEALRQAMTARNNHLASVWGGVVGKGIGWLSGIAIGYGIAYICPVIGGAALARAILSAGTKEALEEIGTSLSSALVQTGQAISANLFAEGFIQFRTLLKKAPKSLLESIYGPDTASFIQNVWGNKGGPNMSFNYQMNEAVESISNEALKNFIEELLDESWDSFTEAGFVIAAEIDSAYAQHKQAKKDSAGPDRSLTLTFDKEAKEETIKLVGIPQEKLVETVQTQINQHRLIWSRDVGNVLGTPEASYGGVKPFLRQLLIQFRSRPEPPWRHLNGKRAREINYAIPDPKVSLSWEQIKTAAKHYTWGKFRCTASLASRRQIAVYGASAAEAKQKLLELMTLSNDSIVSMSITEEEQRPEKMKKDPTIVYPCYGVLVGRKQSLDGTGKVTLDNKTLDEKRIRFALWTETEPRNFKEIRWDTED